MVKIQINQQIITRSWPFISKSRKIHTMNEAELKTCVKIIGAAEHLIVIQQKLIDKQVAYLIVNSTGTRRSWVKLWNANQTQRQAIMKYESDRNQGIQPVYYPQAEAVLQEDESSIYRSRGRVCNGEDQNISRYNLRERQLLLISRNEFYGLQSKQQKKQNIPNKKQIKKEEVRTKTKTRSKPKQIQILLSEEQAPGKDKNKRRHRQQKQIFNVYSSNSQNLDCSGQIKQKMETGIYSHKADQKRKGKSKLIIDIQDKSQKKVNKRKLIKKQEQAGIKKQRQRSEDKQLQKDKHKQRHQKELCEQAQSYKEKIIQIYDGSDSELKML